MIEQFKRFQKNTIVFLESELKRNNASILCFLRECREEFLKTKPKESGIERIGSAKEEINLQNRSLSLFSMICLGSLMASKNLWRVDLGDSGITMQHLEALNFVLGKDDSKVNHI